MDASTRGPAALVADLIEGYRPATRREADDVERVRALLAGPDGGDPWLRGNALHLTGSALVVHPGTGRVLLRWHERLGTWLQVGGHGDPGEVDPLAVAVREAVEETGLTDVEPWPDGALRHVVVVPVPASAKEPVHEHADLRFLLSTGTPEAVRAENERAPLRWASPREAAALTASADLRETLARVVALLG